MSAAMMYLLVTLALQGGGAGLPALPGLSPLLLLLHLPEDPLPVLFLLDTAVDRADEEPSWQ